MHKERLGLGGASSRPYGCQAVSKEKRRRAGNIHGPSHKLGVKGILWVVHTQRGATLDLLDAGLLLEGCMG